MKKIRIFISSPGDVLQERQIARRVIEDLNKTFSKFVKIEVLMWEDFPLTADSTFQDGINYFLEQERIDIAVFVLWSRLGTPLCTKFRKPDGTPYKSGTEYEFDLMMNLFKQKGYPQILTYVKNKDFIPQVASMKELSDVLRQKELLEFFLEENFHDKDTNSNYAYLQFGEHTTFEVQLKNHLIGLIKRIVGYVGDIREWDGNPYVGLSSFEYDQNAIFFGRKQLIYETAAKLVNVNNESQKKSLLLLGESGSGKSSFVKAGILPFFCQEKGKGYITITPTMFGGNIYHGIIDLLLENYKFLADNPFIEEIKEGISDKTNFKYLSHAFSCNAHDNLIIYIDQFEEIFTDNQIQEDERRKVIELIRGLVTTQCIHIFISMRNDFYGRLVSYGGLSDVKDYCEIVDMPQVSTSDISDIVNEPALKACLRWEIDNNGEPLNKRIIKDVEEIRDLALIEFALSELYNYRDENDTLTYDAYYKIGGLKGAVVSYADSVFNELSDKEKDALSDVLGFVVTKSSANNTYVRKTSLQKDVFKTDIHKRLVEHLIKSRLLISGKDNKGNATVTLVHETLIKQWKVIGEWTSHHQDFLSSNSYYEQRAQHWITDSKSNNDLIKGRSALLEAEYFNYKYSNQASDATNDFILASIKKERRKFFVPLLMLTIISLFSLGSLICLKCFDIDYDQSLNEWYSFDELSLVDIMLMAPIFVIPLQGLIIKAFSRPKYKTIKYSLAFWTVLLAISILEAFRAEDFMTVCFYLVPIIVVTIVVLFEFLLRKQWNRRKVFYPISDKWWERISSIFIAAVLFCVIIPPSLISYFSLQEKNEKLESTIEVADKLFRGLDNIQDRLSYSDVLYLNNLHRDYLAERFRDELLDTIRDDREQEYAKCLLNLSYPDKARNWLYYSNWYDHLLMVECFWQEGKFDLVEALIEEYVSAERYDYQAENLIWDAERIGRFDLAEKLYSIIEANNADLTNFAYDINRGHIFLSNGDLEKALVLYNKALDVNPDAILNIKNDLHILSRFQAVEESKLKTISNMLKVDYVPAYTKPNEEYSAEIHDRLLGNWICEIDTSYVIQLEVVEDSKMYRTHLFDSSGDELYRAISLVNCEETSVGILWDEYMPKTDEYNRCIITSIEDDSFTLRILGNGNPEDSGTERIFTREKEE